MDQDISTIISVSDKTGDTISRLDLTDMERLYWVYIKLRLKELIENKLTNRLVIDIQRGVINDIQDQQIIAGASQLVYNITNMLQ